MPTKSDACANERHEAVLIPLPEDLENPGTDLAIDRSRGIRFLSPRGVNNIRIDLFKRLTAFPGSYSAGAGGKWTLRSKLSL